MGKSQGKYKGEVELHFMNHFLQNHFGVQQGMVDMWIRLHGECQHLL